MAILGAIVKVVEENEREKVFNWDEIEGLRRNRDTGRSFEGVERRANGSMSRQEGRDRRGATGGNPSCLIELSSLTIKPVLDNVNCLTKSWGS